MWARKKERNEEIMAGRRQSQGEGEVKKNKNNSDSMVNMTLDLKFFRLTERKKKETTFTSFEPQKVY